ncbi:MAG: PhoH family protein [Methanobrevibacter sp.]|nr:PhoH family protein [Methanobrevibacter sp.]
MEEKEYTGWKYWTPSDEELVYLYQEGSCPLDLVENEYLIVKDRTDDSVAAIYKKKNGQVEKINRAAIKINDPKDGRVKKVYNPRNSEQVCAFDLLHDDSVTVKLITGRWGTGKTLLLVTAALEALREKRFEKIVWIRNNVEVKDTPALGILPGEIIDKLLPYLGPFIDHVGDKQKIEKMIKEGQLEVEPLQSLRGRNIENAIIMCSEAENLSKEHIQLILARAAEGSAVWMDGDIFQRDRVSFEKSKGLETMIKRLSDNPLFGYVKLIKTERSATAALADKLD